MDNNNGSPYVSRPQQDGPGRAYREYNNSANAMARTASTMGVVAVISIFTMMIYPAIVLGSLAVILALLSRDRDGHMHDKAKSAVTTGLLAIGVNIALLAVTFGLLFSGGSFKNQINDTFEEIYGHTFDEMWEDAMDGSLDLDYRNLPLGGGKSSPVFPSDT